MNRNRNNPATAVNQRCSSCSRGDVVVAFDDVDVAVVVVAAAVDVAANVV